MKAIICTKYGSPDVLQLAELDMPVPKDNEVRIKVRATTVTSGDCRVRGFRSPLLYWIPMRLALGMTKPRRPVLGVELSGEVEAVGRSVTKFKPGDRVFAMTGMRFGAYAEYVCLPERGLIGAMPAGASYEEAAAVLFGGTTALHFLRKAKLRSGESILVYGASGAVGTSSIQMAKSFGAKVTAVCSAANRELVRSLGADHVIDYAKEDFADGDRKYDIVFDAVGKISKAAGKRALNPGGAFVTVDGQGVARELIEDLVHIRNLMETGKLVSVIDRRYPLEQMRDAHRYVDSGRKKGNVVITLSHNA